MICDPLESACCDQADNQQIIPAEAAGVFPIVAILVRALEGYIEQRTFFGILLPDAGANGAVTDLVYGLIIGCTG